MAVREGFEPSIHFRVYTLSRRAPSATRTPHHIFVAKSSLQRGATIGVGPIRSRIISVFLFVRSSRAHFAENCGERQGTCHEWVRKSAVSSWITDGNGDHCRRGERCSPLSAVHHAKSLDANPGFLLNLAVREGLIRCAHPAGRRWRSKTQAFCRTLSRLLPSRRCTMQKAWTRIQAFSLNLAVRGLDSLRSPCGPPLAVQNAGVLSNPVEASPLSAVHHAKSLDANPGFLLNLAVREGFEPSIHFRVYTLSRRAPSATQTPHRFVAENALRCRRALM